MLVTLPREAWCRWLGADKAEVGELLHLLQAYPTELMRAYPVGQRVGSVRQ